MRILIVAAVAEEVAPIVAALGEASADRAGRTRSYEYAGHAVDVLLTGVGMVATAAWCSRALAECRYDLALNLGVCGSFSSALQPGAVVHVISDRLAELGAEDDARFLTLQELRLKGDELFVNTAPPSNLSLVRLPSVTGITVNTVHGNERSIATVVRRCGPDVESMEGAAFMCACLIHDVPFAQIRAVSNIVEKRNRAAWKMADAVRNLGEAALDIIKDA